MGPTWGRQDPGGPHVGHVNLAIWAEKAYRDTTVYWYMNMQVLIYIDLH